MTDIDTFIELKYGSARLSNVSGIMVWCQNLPIRVVRAVYIDMTVTDLSDDVVASRLMMAKRIFNRTAQSLVADLIVVQGAQTVYNKMYAELVKYHSSE